MLKVTDTHGQSAFIDLRTESDAYRGAITLMYQSDGYDVAWI